MPKTDRQISSFETDTTAALGAVRSSLAAMTNAIGGKIQRPADLQRSLGVDSKLSWQIFNVINECDPLSAAKLVPGEPSLKRLLQAASSRGVSDEHGEAIRDAITNFNRVVERHAEDRAEFDFMAASVASPAEIAAAELLNRKLAYQAESRIWGVSTDTFSGINIIRRAPDGKASHICSIATKQGCRRLRADAPLNILGFNHRLTSPPPSDPETLPLDPEASGRYGYPILPDFCSQPLPDFAPCQFIDSKPTVHFHSREIGKQSSLNLTLGVVFPHSPDSKDISGRPLYFQDVRQVTPTRVVLSYLLAHRPSFGRVNPGLMIFRQCVGDENAAVAMSAPQIPVRETVRYLGAGPATWSTSEIDNHAAIIQSAFDRLGWNPVEFDVFRVRVEYPVLHSVLRLSFPIED